MPDFELDRLYVSPREFVNTCDKHEIDMLTSVLIKDKIIASNSVLFGEHKGNFTFLDEELLSALDNIFTYRMKLSNESTDIIKKISNEL